ncbi:APC family permease [Pseudarthrobacter sp. lyk4-40-TYG-27]|uniref:APC family permease n=1 Tax=Pseudarthrobacter sp. lyk4-40-TYG-27 TaxID=3040305 RepID=UPI002556E48E|nr:APC family permease [Pseudarthrobacter sp. lyk4-40-TYG-27]
MAITPNLETTAPASTPANATPKLSGTLGVGAIVFMVVAAASPLTMMAGAAPLGFLLGNGIGFPSLFLVCALILVLFAVGLTAMTRHVPKPGTFFAYIGYGLGRPPGLAAAYLAITAYTAVQIAVYGYMGQVLSTTAALLGGPALPWWLYSIAAIGSVGVLGYFRIDLSSKVLGFLLIAEIAVLTAIVVAVAVTGGSEGLSMQPFEIPNIVSGAPGVGLMIAMSGFIGFEAVTVFRDEAKDPDKTIPRATYGAVLGIGTFYAVVTWALVMAWGPDQIVEASSDPASMLLKTAYNYLGPAGEAVVNVLLVTSLFACVLSLHNVLTRYQHAMSVAGLLPKSLSRVHERHNSPYFSSVVQTVTVLALMTLFAVIGLDPVLQIFTWCSGMTPLAIAVLMAMTSVAVIVYFRRHASHLSAWHTVTAPVLGFIGLAVAIGIMLTYFPLLVGDVNDAGDPAFGATSVILLGVILLALVAGLIQAAVLKARNPGAYDNITEAITT